VISIEPIKKEVLKILGEKKSEEIVEFDLSMSQAKLSDSCIIASGTSSRHMQSVADYVYRFLKSQKLHPVIEGNAKCGWVFIEAAGIEIHLFKPELREYYALETLMNTECD
jgi:ribosome-associated protein